MGTPIDSGVTIYCGDSRDILPRLGLDPKRVAIVADPPYGIGLDTENRARKRGSGNRSAGSTLRKIPEGDDSLHSTDYPAVYGDDEPFDPSWLLEYRRIILFGANYFAHLLPPSPAWIFWDKTDGLQSKRELGFNDGADGEMIWTNASGQARIIGHRWAGAMKASEQREKRVHPTQKPIELMRMIIRHYTDDADIIVDPYAGSGATAIAAYLENRRAIAIEKIPDYCQIIHDRLQAAIAGKYGERSGQTEDGANGSA